MKIALVVGHDSDNKGAYGNEGVSEWDFYNNLINSMTQYNMLQEKHEIYVMYRSSDINGYTAKMRDLHKRIDKIGCEVSIELHFNSFHKPEVNGNEVLYCSDEGREIAKIFDEELDSLPNRDRGIKKVSMHPHPVPDDRGAGFCCRGKSKAIILEPFFGVNQSKYIYGGSDRMNLMECIQRGLNRL